MATTGSKKALSVKHEDFIAALYGGKRSKSSGAAITDGGDVRAPTKLIECKMTGKPGTVKRNKVLNDFEKIADEAFEEGREPLLALRYWDSDSVLSGPDGYIDLVVKLASDDNGN